MELLLRWLPTVYILLDSALRLFILFRGKKRLGLISVLLLGGFMVYMYWFATSAVGLVYNFYLNDGLNKIGQFMGLVLLPTGYTLGRWLVHREIKSEKMNPEMRRKFEIVMSFVTYPVIAFLLFFLSYLIIGIAF